LLSVSDLVRDLDLPVHAGEANLDAPVRWVHISELLDPTPWLSGGEVLLTTGMQLDTPERQREFVSHLADHRLAALGLGTGFQHKKIPDAVIEAAVERDFPVFEVPYELPFIAITEAAFTRLVNEQYAVLRHAISAHERLERIVLSERGLDALGSAIASMVEGSVVVFDGQLKVRGNHGFDSNQLEALASQLRARAEARAFMPSLADGGDGLLALPVTAEGSRVPQAWLIAAKSDGPLSDFDRLVLHQAVTIIALELMRGRVAEETERRLAGDVLRAMAAGELTGPELVRRLEPFELGTDVATIVSEEADGALASALRDEATPALVASTAGLTCALVPGLEEEDLFALASRLGKRVAPARLGVGRAVESGHARRSFHEARCALEAASLGGVNGSGVATYRDLGSFQLLLSLQDDEALRLFCDSILGPIESSEGRYGGELMRSLEAFIECNGQWERAAQQLYCHRHTLRYRMKRIETLTGRSLQNARDRIDFWLALRGRELIAGRPRELV
jgi:PucR family transcriptional regulator, purine catabolism regulatory protein